MEPIEELTTGQESFLLRSCRRPLIVWSLLISPIALLSCYLIIVGVISHANDTLERLQPLLLVLALYMLGVAFCRGISLRIDGNRLTYQFMYYFKSSINICSISKAEFTEFNYSDGNAFRPGMCLEIHSPEIKRGAWNIPYAVFDAAQLNEFLRLLTGMGVKMRSGPFSIKKLRRR